MYRCVSHYLTRKVYYTIFIPLLFVIFYAINTNHEFFLVHILLKTSLADKTYDTNNEESLQGQNIDSSKKQIATETKKSFSDRIAGMKYILIWTNPRNTPLVYLGEGQSVFMNKSCTWINCYVTVDRNLLGDYTEFEAILFNGPELHHMRYINDLPKRRYERQKYVYANIESAAIYPICSEYWNNFFNWTWSYRTDSDVYWPYYSIRDNTNRVIGPKSEINWINTRDMDPIDKELKAYLSTKTKAAAWFASNCETQSLREHFVEELQEQMVLYDLELDIFGDCGKLLQCPRKIMSRCHRMLDKHYYFYLAFENSLSEDYVSEKILHGLLHNTVPIVLGGANYSRFIPEGAYLNALELGATKLARKMYELIQNLSEYYDFFKWKKYYSFHYTHESPDTDVYCRLCDYLNNKEFVNQKSVYRHFNLWWTPQKYCSHVINAEIH